MLCKGRFTSFPLITPELIARIEQFHLRFNFARMKALRDLEGNPYHVEVERFGGADNQLLFITASTSVYGIRMRVHGVGSQ